MRSPNLCGNPFTNLSDPQTGLQKWICLFHGIFCSTSMHIPPACFQKRPNLLANHRSGQSHPEMERHPPPDAEQSWTSCSFNGKPWSYIWEIVISNDKLMITTDTIIVSDNGGFTCGRNDTTLARKWIKIGGSMAPNISLPWFNLLCLCALCVFCQYKSGVLNSFFNQGLQWGYCENTPIIFQRWSELRGCSKMSQSIL